MKTTSSSAMRRAGCVRLPEGISWRLVDGGQQNRITGRELALNPRLLAMSQTVLIALVVVAAILIVFGRVNRRTRWGNWVAVAGFAVLALAALLRVMA